VTAFGEADTLAVTEIYAAGEEPLPGVSGSKLLETIDHPAKTFLPTPHDAAGYLAPIIGTGDMIVFLGAGSVGAAAWSFAHAHGIALVDRGESPASDLATPPPL
jgi:UDP-N-acetylmuramate--alanine ligase